MQPEHQFQVWAVRQLRNSGIYCFAIPNGARRDRITGAMLKNEGVLAGVADLALLLDKGETVFVELKNGKKGVQSDAQKEFQGAVEKLGFTYLLWRERRDVLDFIEGYFRMKKGGK